MAGNDIIATTELYIEPVEDQNEIKDRKEILLADLPAIGVGFEPVKTAIQTVFSSGEATSGLYRVTIPNGGQLASFKDGSGYLGTVLKENGAVGGGQARLNPVVFDPTMFCMALTLMNIQRKMNSIQKSLDAMMTYFDIKQKTELQGSLIFLSDILCHFQYNWNNDQYKSNSHLKAMDIRQQAEQGILFAKEKINDNIQGRLFDDEWLLHGDQEVKKEVKKINTLFEEYRLAVYLFSMASYVELLLLGNTDADYLKDVSDKIKEYSYEYRNLYTKAYDKMEKVLNRSIDGTIVKGLASAGLGAGKVVSKVPLMNRTPINKYIQFAGKSLKDTRVKKDTHTLTNFKKLQDSHATLYIDSINQIKYVYNEQLVVLFDREKVYLPNV